jgi:fermentation-respiration switch protein FrsA (DUF1100 family)
MLYFHGNAEDIGHSRELLVALSKELGVHVLAPEYPGYGMYIGKPTMKLIADEALRVYDYVTAVLHWKEENIIVCGRSIGTGFATHIAAHRNPGMLILISAFTSIKDVVKDFAWWAAFLIADHLSTLELITHVKCPKIFIHGQADNFVLPANSQRLFEASAEPKELVIRPKMDHSTLALFDDLIDPIAFFWDRLSFNTDPTAGSSPFSSLGAIYPEWQSQPVPTEFLESSKGDRCCL